MKNALICATVAVLALVAWLLWPTADDGPPPAGGGAAGGTAIDPSVPSPAAPASPEMRQADAAPELLREPVDQPTGPTGARVTVVWANDGEPAAAIPVLVYRAEGRRLVGPVATAATDATGVVTFADLTAGEHSFQAARARVRTRANLDPGVQAEIGLTLQAFAVVRGIVVDADEAPIAAAEVAAEFSAVGGIGGTPHPAATTGVNGRFRVRLPSRARIWASKEGHGPSRLHDVSGDIEDLVLPLEAAGASIHGVVLDPDGRPVAHATVAVAIDLDVGTGRGRPQQAPVMLETDARGEFATAQVPRGTLIVYAYAEGFGFGQQDVDTAGTGTASVVVRLPRAVSIHGIVLGGENGDEPIFTSIDIHRQRDLPGLLKGTSDRLTRANTVPDSEGRYRITGLSPGRMWVVAMVSPSPVHHNVVLREGEDYEWNPDMSRPSGVISGVLQGPDGEPLAGWQISAIHVDLIEMERDVVRAETDGDGRFELLELRPYPHTVTVLSPERGETVAVRAEVQPDDPPFVWRLPGLPSQSGEIVGRVLGPDGQPVGHAEYTASSEGISRTSSPPLASEDGFRIRRAIPGTWHVVGQLEGYGSFDLGRHWVAANAIVDVGTHRLPPRGAAIVRLTGRGFEPAGIELALEQVEGGENEASEFTADEGALRSPALPPGRYRLLARGANFAPIARDVTIPPGRDVAVDLDAEPAATVAIEFVPEELADREWQDYLRLELRDAVGAVVLTRAQEVRGAPTATLTIGLPAGAHTIEAWSTNTAYRRGSSSFVVPSDTSDKREVRVLLEVQKR